MKNIFFKKKAEELKLTDLLRMSRSLQIGIESGKDWIQILDWIADHDPQKSVQSSIRAFGKRLRLEGAEKVLEFEKRKSHDSLWKLLLEIFSFCHRGHSQIAQVFKNYHQIAESILRLKQKEASFLFIPKFQTWMAIVIVLFFLFILPLFSPIPLATFISLGRWDFFCSCLAVIGLGFFLLKKMCDRPQKDLGPRLQTTFFFYFLSLFLDAGLDFASAWNRSLQSVKLSPDVHAALSRPGLKIEGIDKFLKEASQKLSGDWPEILTGILWARKSGIGLSDYLKDLSRQESERLAFLWEDQLRKLSMTTLIPLCFLICPATLTLLIGPQLMELANF